MRRKIKQRYKATQKNLFSQTESKFVWCKNDEWLAFLIFLFYAVLTQDTTCPPFPSKNWQKNKQDPCLNYRIIAEKPKIHKGIRSFPFLSFCTKCTKFWPNEQKSYADRAKCAFCVIKWKRLQLENMLCSVLPIVTGLKKAVFFASNCNIYYEWLRIEQ